jgi:hypothetical protein
LPTESVHLALKLLESDLTIVPLLSRVWSAANSAAQQDASNQDLLEMVEAVNKALNFESVVDGTNAFVRLFVHLPPDKRLLLSTGKLRKDLHQYHLCALDLVSKNGHNRHLAKKYRDVSSICSWALVHVRSPQDLAKLLSHTNASSSAACKWEEANKHMNAVLSWYDSSRTRDSSAREDVNLPRVVTHHTVLEQQVKALAATHMNFCCLDDTNMMEPKGRRCKPPKRPECSNTRPGTTDSVSSGARKPFENDQLKGAATARANSNGGDGGGGDGGGEPSLPPILSGTHNPKVGFFFFFIIYKMCVCVHFFIFLFLQHVCACVSQHMRMQWNDVFSL